MQHTRLPLCSRCLLSVFSCPSEIRASSHGHITRRMLWSTTPHDLPVPPRPPQPFKPPRFRSKLTPQWKPRSQSSPTPPIRTQTYTKIDHKNPTAFFEYNVDTWISHPRLQTRLESFGVPQDHIRPLLTAFATAVKTGSLSTPTASEHYILSRFSQMTSSRSQIDITYSTIFYAWTADPANHPQLLPLVSQHTLESIQRLAKAADRSHPAEEFSLARRMRRKVIMHVGPTNSGKTHHALRALAASRRGVYAGPLRLLAHEIWERLNLGEIVPLGVEEPEVGGQKVAVELDVGAGANTPVKRWGNPLYARKCNMMTGEEQKIVDEGAPLLACTVEMLAIGRMYDVAVVDEIQMIADEQRGSAWTTAVLGLCAEELHLCGEETAVPIVEALLKDTGDELVINRYTRLTPLEVEKESLNGDLGLVRPGDCIVTFSRSNIFGLKRKVEEKTGMRCAVVYGRLPPEIRSEQAALFNDPDSGYDVIIGSDAIGMGLNLYVIHYLFQATISVLIQTPEKSAA